MASISACAVGSNSSRVRFPVLATTWPSGATRTAPTGTSPRAAASRASASARSIWLILSGAVIKRPSKLELDFALKPGKTAKKSFSGRTAPKAKAGAKPRARTAGANKRAQGQAALPERDEGPMRIAKAMARAGLCSRRDAERWIADGRVSVNGKVLSTPAVTVSQKDKIVVDGQEMGRPEPAQLWRYYKPKGLVTTNKDPQGRPTVFDNLPEGLPRVMSVGRLDFNTEGLLLLTNDGELARYLEMPSTGWLRRYRVRARGRVSQADLDNLKDGVEVEGIRYGPVEAFLDQVSGANAWLTVGIREGKNREVRKLMSHLGLEVNRLIRVSFGPFQLLDLKPGAAEHVRRKVLADQLGPQAAGVFGLTGLMEEERAERKARARKPQRDAGGER